MGRTNKWQTLRFAQELILPNAENVHFPLVKDFEGSVITGRPPVVPLAEAVRTNVYSVQYKQLWVTNGDIIHRNTLRDI